MAFLLQSIGSFILALPGGCQAAFADLFRHPVPGLDLVDFLKLEAQPGDGVAFRRREFVFLDVLDQYCQRIALGSLTSPSCLVSEPKGYEHGLMSCMTSPESGIWNDCQAASGF